MVNNFSIKKPIPSGFCIAACALMLSLSGAARAMTVDDYFSYQMQAEEGGVMSTKAKALLANYHNGLTEGLFAALYFNGGELDYDGAPLVCLPDIEWVSRQHITDVIRSTLGTYDLPRMSESAANAMPVGMHVVIGLSKRFPCKQ